MSAAPYRAAVKRFGLVGHPVSHSVSPAMMKAAFESLGLPFTYDAVDAPDAAALGRELTALRAGERAGLNVTLPHKVAACRLADVVAESARRTGAANVLVREAAGRVRAENTDAEAIARVVGPKLTAKRWAVVFGSGGAARAAMVACDMLGFRGVEVTSRSWRSPEMAWELGADLPELRAQVQFEPWDNEWGGPAELGGREVDLLLQATSAGMKGGGPSDELLDRVPWEAVTRRTVAFDAVYRPRVTPFLAEAKRRGLVVEDGLGMLVEQAALSLSLWLGAAAPRDVMLRAAERALAT